MTIPIIQVILLQLILPGIFLIWLWAWKCRNRAEWLILSLAAGGIVCFALIVGNWSWTSFYLRIIIFGLLIIGIIKSWRQTPHMWKPVMSGNSLSENSFILSHIVVALILVPMALFAASGYFTEDESIDLQFPLRNGVYAVGQGGSNPMLNYHNAYESQQYALDIVKLNVLGVRAAGLYPKKSRAYAIYGDSVFSPCDGIVTDITSDLPDYTPPNRDQDNPAGNHVAIETRETRLLLAHLQNESIAVDVSDSVSTGQFLGMVGNSGNTTEPHLHIHAERNGVGVPMRFDGRFLARNALVWR